MTDAEAAAFTRVIRKITEADAIAGQFPELR